MTSDAKSKMTAIGKRFVAAQSPNPYGWTFDDVEGVANELLALGFITNDGRNANAYCLTEPGRSWVLTELGLVVAFCPKCSTDEYVPKGDAEARVRCHVCGVGWTENTTVDPFVPKY